MKAWFFLLVVVVVGGDEGSGKRQTSLPAPELVSSRVIPMEAEIMNQKHEYVVTTLEFDQDLYVNEPFVCAGSERECEVQDCVPCDWTGSERIDCLNDTCCGPAQWPTFAQYSRRNDWCDDSLPEFTKLNFGEISELVTTNEDEYHYFRFFVGDEEYCKPISITVHTDYGQTLLLVHNLMAYPSYDNLYDTNADYRQFYQPGRWMRSNGWFSYAQSVLEICPNVSPPYSKGTYSIAIKTLSNLARYAVEVRLGEDEYPILPPSEDDSFNCTDVPAEEFEVKTFGDEASFRDVFCLDEGITQEYRYSGQDNDKLFELILPVMPGCREIQLAFNGYTGLRLPGGDRDNNIYCFQTSDSRDLTTAFIGRARAFDDSIYFAGCFDEVTFIHCTAYSNAGAASLGMFYWTSHATPRRYKMSEISEGQLSMVTGAGHAGSVAPDLAYETFLNWGFQGVSYLTQPTDDPIVFWPPYEPHIYHFRSSPTRFYRRSVSGEKMDNTVVIVDITTRNNLEIRNRDKLLENGFVALPGITNIEGTPLKLANNGKVLSNRSMTEWVSHQTLSSLNIMRDYSSLCDSDRYYDSLRLIDRLTQGALAGSDFEFVSEETYKNDIFRAALARQACVQAVEKNMEQESSNFSRVELNYCGHEFESEEWLADPCCNARLQAWMCCGPQSVSEETDLFIGADQGDVDGICGNSGCAVSYFSDISKSLNSRGNPLLGCSAGIQDPVFELDVRFEKELESFIRPCLVRAGFGERYEGVSCESTDDCAEIGLGCSLGMCNIGSTQDAQDRYLDCFLEEMPSFVEHYIRTSVLNKVDGLLPRDSALFREAVKDAATINNCINPNNPLDILQSERWVADSPVYCKAFSYQFDAYTEVDEINAACPPRICLGEKTCVYDDVTVCRQTAVSCSAYEHTYYLPEEVDCPVDEQQCNYGDISECSGSTCVLCDGERCEEVDLGVTATQALCESLVMCETSTGERRFDLTREECESMDSSCDSLCPIQACTSEKLAITGSSQNGVCVFPNLTTAVECEAEGWRLYTHRIETPSCMPSNLNQYSTRDECEALGTTLPYPTRFATCGDLELDVCAGSVFPEAAYHSLFCDLNDFSECPTEEACLNSGVGCTDLSLKRVAFNRGQAKATIYYGTCYGSGTTGFASSKVPTCNFAVREQNDDNSCRFSFNPFRTENVCSPMNATGENGTYRRVSWISPSLTKEECLRHEFGRVGCVLPGSVEERTHFWVDDGACDCMRGTLHNVFEWNNPQWLTPTAHSLEWVQKRSQTRYEWESSLSLTAMEGWVESAVEHLFVVTYKSQLVCRNNYLTSSLTTLVCDCFGGEDQAEDGNCYSTASPTTTVGSTLACGNEDSLIKGPPSFATFSTDSIKDQCTEVALDLIQQSLFLFPPSIEGVSFQFAERRQKGAVLNKNDATVGEIMGDGSKLIFDVPELVNFFSICLLVSNEENNKYTVRDFGTPSDDFSFIQPLGIEEIEERKEESSTYWCANIGSEYLVGDDGSSATFFPVLVLKNAEDEEEDPYDHQTTSLLYTLGACYCVDLVLLLIYMVVIFKNFVCVGNNVPLVTYIAVIFGIVCIFRICFCFIYVDGGFEDNQLAEYVVFEIPTFLLFTAVIIAIGLFLRLSKKSTFDFKGADRKLWACGLIACLCVWSIFIIVTVVYSEVILEEESESSCPGREPSDNSKQEEDSRTLSIVYQSVVIFLTLCFSLFFLRATVNLFQMSKNAAKAKRFIFRVGSVLVIAFLLRCVLFLVLLAIEITSDIYLFVTLMLTEALMMLLIALEFNERFYNRLASAVMTTASSRVSEAVGSNTRSGTTSGHGSSHGSSL